LSRRQGDQLSAHREVRLSLDSIQPFDGGDEVDAPRLAAGQEMDSAREKYERQWHPGAAVFEPLLAAARTAQAVTFDHRHYITGEVKRRTVEPWGVLSDSGRWYLVGHDRDHDDVRAFRMSRMAQRLGPSSPP
jgi:predicted DNA-binding transcriptional regulator YafY